MSSTEAEFFCCVCCGQGSTLASSVLFSLTLASTYSVLLGCLPTDNKGVVDLAFDAVALRKTKHILHATEFVRGLTLRRVSELQSISVHMNPADLLTKAFVLATTFRKLLSLLRSITK